MSSSSAEKRASMSSASSGTNAQNIVNFLADNQENDVLVSVDTEGKIAHNEDIIAPIAPQNIVGPPQLSDNGVNDPFFSLMEQRPMDSGSRVEAKDNIIDLLSVDDNLDEPLFDYPHDDSASSNTVSVDVDLITPVDKTSSNGLLIDSESPNLLCDNSQALENGGLTNNSADNSVHKQPVSDPFDIFAAPAPTSNQSNIDKDPFDLFI